MNKIKLKASFLVILMIAAAVLMVIPQPSSAQAYSYILIKGKKKMVDDFMYCHCMLGDTCYCRMKVDLN